MLDISVQIDLNEKKDMESIKAVLMEYVYDSPVYIVEFTDRYQVNYEMEYQSGDVEYCIRSLFSDYEFVEFPESQRKIRLVMRITQSPLSTDGWGRMLNTDTIERTLYLVKKQNEKNSGLKSEPNPTFKVLFGNTEKEYTVNVVAGINKTNNEEGYLVVKQIGDTKEKPDLLVNKLFKDKSSAFWGGYHALNIQIEEAFEAHKKARKKKRKK